MNQTLAIFLDTYRELNSKRLFWFVLAISAVVVLVFALIGINEKGLEILWWEIEAPFNTTLFTPELFYKTMFLNLGIGFWIGWLATILALISTASLIPDFIAGGAIELTLSKPIGRTRLFLTKYIAAVLFVALQVTVFCLGAFLVIGLRGGAWEPGIFIAVPLLTLFFSYLFCVCALVGLVTRSTMSALLITMFVWLLAFAMNTTHQVLTSISLGQQMQAEAAQARIDDLTSKITAAGQRRASADAPGDPAPSVQEKPSEGGIAALARWASQSKEDQTSEDRAAEEIENLLQARKGEESRLAEITESSAQTSAWKRRIGIAKAVFPKTSETKDLIERTLVEQADIDRLVDSGEREGPDFGSATRGIDKREYVKRLEALNRAQPASYIIGSSLAFEAVVLGICVWRFRRRDF